MAPLTIPTLPPGPWSDSPSFRDWVQGVTSSGPFHEALDALPDVPDQPGSAESSTDEVTHTVYHTIADVGRPLDGPLVERLVTYDAALVKRLLERREPPGSGIARIDRQLVGGLIEPDPEDWNSRAALKDRLRPLVEALAVYVKNETLGAGPRHDLLVWIGDPPLRGLRQARLGWWRAVRLTWERALKDHLSMSQNDLSGLLIGSEVAGTGALSSRVVTHWDASAPVWRTVLRMKYPTTSLVWALCHTQALEEQEIREHLLQVVQEPEYEDERGTLYLALTQQALTADDYRRAFDRLEAHAPSLALRAVREARDMAGRSLDAEDVVRLLARCDDPDQRKELTELLGEVQPPAPGD